MKTEIVQIIVVATNNYRGYLNGFLLSLSNFLPDYKKTVTVITDKDLKLDRLSGNNIIDINVVHIFDMFYPSINLNKMYIVKQAIDETCDYVFYFDADTIFIENKNYNWDSFIEKCDTGKVLLERTPVYNVVDDFIFNIGDRQVDKGYFIQAIINYILGGEEWRKSYINELKHEYICTAFFGGNKNAVINFCDDVNYMIKIDYSEKCGYYVPHTYDEAYVNKLANINSDAYIIGAFSKLYVYPSNYHEDTFMYQKQIKDELKTNKN